MERRRRFTSVGITRGGGKYICFVKGGLGVLPQENIGYNMSVEAIPIHFEAILSCEFKLILQALSYISNAYDSCFETRPLMSVLTTISTPRWILSDGGIKLATGVVFKLFWGLFGYFFFWGGGSSFKYTRKHFIHMNMGSQQPDKRA